MSSASKRRQVSSDDGGEGANWMDTYGDLVTLLLCFFVLLFSFSSIDAQKWETLAGAFSGSTVVTIPILDPSMAIERPIELILTTDSKSNETDIPASMGNEGIENVDESLMQLFATVEEYVGVNELSADVFVDIDSYTVTIRFGDNIFFNSGDAKLLPESRGVLDKLSELFEVSSELYSMVRVEGHTDDRPIHTAVYDSNWELSGGRAMSALRYIMDSGKIDPTKISGAGYGEYHPAATNDTAEGRAVNRRVDFVMVGVDRRFR